MANIPILETARLRLRGHRASDFAECAAMWADPAVTRYISGRTFSGEEVWARMLRYTGHWCWMRYGFWIIEERETGRFVGEAGLADFHREITPSLSGIPEAGWALAARAHGQGYATEAVRAVLAWGDEHFGRSRIACIIHPENTVSIRVAEKCGFREWVRTTYHDEPAILFER